MSLPRNIEVLYELAISLLEIYLQWKEINILNKYPCLVAHIRNSKIQEIETGELSE